jgi:hypothetical protein
MNILYCMYLQVSGHNAVYRQVTVITVEWGHNAVYRQVTVTSVAWGHNAVYRQVTVTTVAWGHNAVYRQVTVTTVAWGHNAVYKQVTLTTVSWGHNAVYRQVTVTTVAWGHNAVYRQVTVTAVAWGHNAVYRQVTVTTVAWGHNAVYRQVTVTTVAWGHCAVYGQVTVTAVACQHPQLLPLYCDVTIRTWTVMPVGTLCGICSRQSQYFGKSMFGDSTFRALFRRATRIVLLHSPAMAQLRQVCHSLREVECLPAFWYDRDCCKHFTFVLHPKGFVFYKNATDLLPTYCMCTTGVT